MTAGKAQPGGPGAPVLRLVTRDGAEAGSDDRADLTNRGEAGVEEAAGRGDGNLQDEQAGDAREPVGAPSRERAELLRILEALLFSAAQAMSAQKLAEFLPPGEDPVPLLMELQTSYQGRGVNLVRVAGKWSFRTAADLGYLLKRETVEERRLSKAALETLAIIAYHQPVTRAEIEQIRGVSTSAGTLDILLDTTWIRPRGRRRAPGRPVTYGTTEQFLEHFGLDSAADLPGLSELRGAGLLSSQLPPDFSVPQPGDVASLMPDELPLEDDVDEDQADLDLDGGEDEADESYLEAAAAAEAGEIDDLQSPEAEEETQMASQAGSREDAQDLREKHGADKPEPSSG